VWTGGRDGKIFITDIEEGKARCLLDGSKAITCIANDQVNSKLWFGTEDSSIQCIEKQAVCEIEDEEVFTKPTFQVAGLPEMCDYHLMNNKRYVLVKDKEQHSQLWEIETGKCVQSFTQPFNEVKELLAAYDQVHTKENPVPPTWLSIDLRLGVSPD
jgi:WD40 repeat protein